MTEDSSLPEWIRAARAKWRYTGRGRPPFADVPGPGQESVWDYPRPPALMPDAREVRVCFRGVCVALSQVSLRVCETAAPPTFYIPATSAVAGTLEPRAESGSLCEWKGEARYFDLCVPGQRLERAAWSYPDPLPGFEALRDRVAFYPGRVECSLAGERVEPQPGHFYGGWVTAELVGPFKGEPGSEAW